MQTTDCTVVIGKRAYQITSDPGYAKHLGGRFEPTTVALMQSLTDPGCRALDIGANIGITGIALSQLCGQVVAIEPVPTTYTLLRRNVEASGAANISSFNIGLGSKPGELTMQGNEDNASGAFIADKHSINASNHFTTKVRIEVLDDYWPKLGLDRLDFIKMDVEGYELDVLEGAGRVLAEHKPAVFLEMNHVALNLWRGISLPEFRARLLKMFPVVFAVHGTEYRDMTDDEAAFDVLRQHIHTYKFMEIVAGFDRADIERRLQSLPRILAENDAFETARQQESAVAIAANAKAEINRLLGELEANVDHARRLQGERDAAARTVSEIKQTVSWRITQPLRKIRSLIR